MGKVELRVNKDGLFEYNLEEYYKILTDEELDNVYANNSAVDWYKCNLIVNEQNRRKSLIPR